MLLKGNYYELLDLISRSCGRVGWLERAARCGYLSTSGWEYSTYIVDGVTEPRGASVQTTATNTTPHHTTPHCMCRNHSTTLTKFQFIDIHFLLHSRHNALCSPDVSFCFNNSFSLVLNTLIFEVLWKIRWQRKCKQWNPAKLTFCRPCFELFWFCER